MFRPSASLHIHPDEHYFFLQPSDNPDEPNSDPLLSGVLTLSLKKPKLIKSLTVKLVTKYSIDVGKRDGRHDAASITLAQVKLQDANRLFAPGCHTFAFTLAIPSNAAPSMENTEFGSIETNLVAVAEGGSGLMDSNINAIPVCIFLAVNYAPAGDTPNLMWDVQKFDKDLGPYSFSTTSQNFTVGGLFEVNYVLGCVPTSTHLISISGVLATTYTIRSADLVHPPASSSSSSNAKGKGTERTERRRTLLFRITNERPLAEDTIIEAVDADRRPVNRAMMGGQGVDITAMAVRNGNGGGTSSARMMPVQSVPKGGTMFLSHLARIPADYIVRPTTASGSRTPVEITHELVITVTFLQDASGSGSEEPKPLVQTISREVTLASCVCMVPSLLVPPYSEVKLALASQLHHAPTSSSTTGPTSLTALPSPYHFRPFKKTAAALYDDTNGIGRCPCVCNASTAELMDEYCWCGMVGEHTHEPEKEKDTKLADADVDGRLTRHRKLEVLLANLQEGEVSGEDAAGRDLNERSWKTAAR